MHRHAIAILALAAILPAQDTTLADRLKRISKIGSVAERLRAYDELTKSLDTEKSALASARAKVEELLAGAAEARAESILTKTRTATGSALTKTLAKAWSLTTRLKTGRDTLRMLVHNSRGACQETLGLLAKHRRPQEIAKIRAHQQNKAILAYERTLKLKEENPEGSAAKAWALYRIAVLSEAIADFHEGISKSYRKLRRQYPQAHLVGKFRIKSHRARIQLSTRIKADDEKHGDALMDKGRAQVLELMDRAHEWATQAQEVVAALDTTEAMRQAREAIDNWNAFRKAAGLPGVIR